MRVINILGSTGSIGTQALQNGYTGWYAPATNMHRSPFNGRNYEY